MSPTRRPQRLAWSVPVPLRSVALASVALVASVALAPVARAHDSAPGVLGVEEQDDGRYLVAWTAPVDTRSPSASRLAPRFPEGCVRDGVELDCGARGLEGEIAIEGLEGRMRVAVVVVPRDEAPIEGVLDATHPSLEVRAADASFLGWIALGAEHVLLGLDHLAFLLGLLFVSRIDRRLVLTLTAFTLAHSITLALAVLDLVRPSSPLVEALIALSVLLVAREGLEAPERGAARTLERPWSVRRAPALVAGFFGLVHGLGLAGALRETALPSRALVPALVGFNVGVELGQLVFVGAALAVAALVGRAGWAPRARTALVYAVGSAAAYWLVVRSVAILTHVAL